MRYKRYDTVNKEADTIWEEIKKELPKAESINLDILRKVSLKDSVRDRKRFLGLWFVLIEKSLCFLTILWFYVLDCNKLTKSRFSNAFGNLVSQNITIVNSIKLLIENGFEEQARPLVRVLFESMDISLVLLIDHELSKCYFNIIDDNDDSIEEKFWEKHIGYGKIKPKLEEVLIKAGRTKAEIDDFFQTRSLFNKNLSGSIHCDSSSMLVASLKPLLRNPNRFSINPFGQIGFFATQILTVVVMETCAYGEIIVNLIDAKEPPELFAKKPIKRAYQSLKASYAVLDVLIQKNYEILKYEFEKQLPD